MGAVALAKAAESRIPSPEGPYSPDVQCGHFFAASGIAVAQKGQSFVVGAAAGGGACSRFICFTTMKMANATIRNWMIVFRKRP